MDNSIQGKGNREKTLRQEIAWRIKELKENNHSGKEREREGMGERESWNGKSGLCHAQPRRPG